MNIYRVIILVILIGDYLLTLVTETLNVRHAPPELPDEFRGAYDEAAYRTSRRYLGETTRFSLVLATVTTVLLVAFILAGGFEYVDRFARSFNAGLPLTALIFAGAVAFLGEIVKLPFSVYHTFVLEAKYGFNRTTPRTFVIDLLKGWVLGALIGGVVFAGIVLLFARTGPGAWLYGWIALTVFQMALMFLAPVVILPLFNKFVPLEAGDLRTAIEEYARGQGFAMKGVFTMDGSRRSTKSNAFFTGFGKYRRIVLFDTLIARHTAGEIVAVLAHEMGHYRRHHIARHIALSVLSTGLMLFILAQFIADPALSAAFGVTHHSVYAGLIFFAFLYAPLGMLLGLAGNALSRRYEYEADAYAAATTRRPEDMIAALKKLSADNLSNLTPHPLKVFLHYGHPPVLARIRAIRARAAREG